MYVRFGDEMEYVGVATKLAEPVWMDRTGIIVDHERDVFGCKVIHYMDHPEMVLCMDEVGTNTSQKVDGVVGGE